MLDPCNPQEHRLETLEDQIPPSRCPRWSLIAGALIAVLVPPAQAAADQGKALAMQTAAARSVGTSTDLATASSALLAAFGQVSPDGSHVGQDALQEVARSTGRSDAIVEAAKFFLVSPVSRAMSGDRLGLTRAGLASTSQRLDAAQFDARLSELPSKWRGSGAVARVLRDPGIPNETRERIIGRYDDAQLLRMFGSPVVSGDAQDVRDVTAAFLFLIRSSWLGAAEAAQVTKYHIEYRISHDPKDKALSFWNGHFVQFAADMLEDSGAVDDAALRRHIGTFAHESGHAIYDRSGTKKRFQADMARHGVIPGMNGIVDEAVAGVCQNRAHVAVNGYGANKDSDANLTFMHDVGKNIASPDAMYARYYHVDVAKTRAQLGIVSKLVASDIMPFLEDQLALLDDPQLAQGLPASAQGVERMPAGR